MNGPEHYRTAETLLANLRDELSGHSGIPLRTDAQQTRMIAEAQVHATLALVAVTVDQTASRGPGDVPQVWMEATA